MEEYGGFETKKELMKYIKQAITLETDVVTQEMIIRQYEEDTNRRKPTVALLDEPTKPARPQTLVQDSDPKENFAMGFFSVGFIGTGLVIFFANIFHYEPAVINTVFSLIITAIGLIPIFGKRRINKRIEQTNNSNYITYNHQMDSYNKELSIIREKNRQRRVIHNENIQKWDDSYKTNRSVLEDNLTHTKDLLKKFYSVDCIYPKYRTLPALTSIYEYFITGRCDSLIGSHGAYNLFEDEVRKNMVIFQLSTVIANLEQIKKTVPVISAGFLYTSEYAGDRKRIETDKRIYGFPDRIDCVKRLLFGGDSTEYRNLDGISHHERLRTVLSTYRKLLHRKNSKLIPNDVIIQAETAGHMRRARSPIRGAGAKPLPRGPGPRRPRVRRTILTVKKHRPAAIRGAKYMARQLNSATSDITISFGYLLPG